MFYYHANFSAWFKKKLSVMTVYNLYFLRSPVPLSGRFRLRVLDQDSTRFFLLTLFLHSKKPTIIDCLRSYTLCGKETVIPKSGILFLKLLNELWSTNTYVLRSTSRRSGASLFFPSSLVRREKNQLEKRSE